MARTSGLLFISAIAFSAFAFVNMTSPAIAQERIELGKVKWLRGLENAKALSAKTGKPIFVQFQEVPG